jgi:murein DD-endopeptidase MepM/ murein hydrolase activator NlpD
VRGLFDLALLTAVAGAAWTRTPLSDLGAATHALSVGAPMPDLLAHFRTEAPPVLQAELEAILVTPPSQQAGAVEEPAPALQTAITVHLGTDAWSALEADLMATDANVEAVLEIAAVGAESRSRAIRRAHNAGAASPESYASHRRFLSQREQRQADHNVADVLTLASAMDLRWPVDPDARISSGFGPRTHPTLGVQRDHEGIDIAVPEGTPVSAAGDGNAKRGESAVSGRYVTIDHGHGVVSSYCHGSDWAAEHKSQVAQGQTVLVSGNTGRSSGPHLHFGLRIGGRPVDPAPFRGRGEAKLRAPDQG